MFVHGSRISETGTIVLCFALFLIKFSETMYQLCTTPPGCKMALSRETFSLQISSLFIIKLQFQTRADLHCMKR